MNDFGKVRGCIDNVPNEDPSRIVHGGAACCLGRGGWGVVAFRAVVQVAGVAVGARGHWRAPGGGTLQGTRGCCMDVCVCVNVCVRFVCVYVCVCMCVRM